MKYYAVLGIFKYLRVTETSGIDFELDLKEQNQQGVIGFIPMFKHKKDAKKFAGKRYEIVEFEGFEDETKKESEIK